MERISGVISETYHSRSSQEVTGTEGWESTKSKINGCEKTFRVNNIGPTHVDLKSCNDQCPSRQRRDVKMDRLDELSRLTDVISLLMLEFLSEQPNGGHHLSTSTWDSTQHLLTATQDKGCPWCQLRWNSFKFISLDNGTRVDVLKSRYKKYAVTGKEQTVTRILRAVRTTMERQWKEMFPKDEDKDYLERRTLGTKKKRKRYYTTSRYPTPTSTGRSNCPRSKKLPVQLNDNTDLLQSHEGSKRVHSKRNTRKQLSASTSFTEQLWIRAKEHCSTTSIYCGEEGILVRRITVSHNVNRRSRNREHGIPMIIDGKECRTEEVKDSNQDQHRCPPRRPKTQDPITKKRYYCTKPQDNQILLHEAPITQEATNQVKPRSYINPVISDTNEA
ncbi:unnamed protein product [Caenorhabditis nigoni]